MTIRRIHSCNLCEAILTVGVAGNPVAIGLSWQYHPHGLIEKPVTETEQYLCFRCLSSLQALPPRCGAGYECNGGPNCGSDHK